jgi:hypothetical protein
MRLTAVIEKAAVQGAVAVKVLGVDVGAEIHQDPGNLRELALVRYNLVKTSPPFVADDVQVDAGLDEFLQRDGVALLA